MKRSDYVVVMVVVCLMTAALALPAAANGLNIYPFPYINTATGDQYEQFQMRQGWHADDLAWYICTDTNSYKLAFDTYYNMSIYWMGLTYAPKLTNALQGIPIVYVVVNCSQGPLFTAAPADAITGDQYAGVWKVVYIAFKPEAVKHAVTNTDAYDPTTNPTGLPSTTDADYSPSDPNEASIVVDCPIVAVGPLGGPWQPAPTGTYRIPQGKAMFDYTYTKMIWLPYWYVYCTDPVTHAISVNRVIVPDAYDPDTVPDAQRLATRIGANPAPGLGAIPSEAQKQFYLMNDPKPYVQYPVVSACPSNPFFPWRNTNVDYSPLSICTVLDRNIPQSSVIKNVYYLQLLLANPPALEVVRDSQRLNAPVLPQYDLP